VTWMPSRACPQCGAEKRLGYGLCRKCARRITYKVDGHEDLTHEEIERKLNEADRRAWNLDDDWKPKP